MLTAPNNTVPETTSQPVSTTQHRRVGPDHAALPGLTLGFLGWGCGGLVDLCGGGGGGGVLALLLGQVGVGVVVAQPRPVLVALATDCGHTSAWVKARAAADPHGWFQQERPSFFRPPRNMCCRAFVVFLGDAQMQRFLFPFSQ